MSTDAEAADDVATPPDTTQDVPPDASEDVEVGVEPRPLSACDGPGGVFVAPADEALVDVEWLGGDLVVRGYAAACGADEVAQELRVRSACGGAFDVTLSTRGVEASVEASLRAEGVLDAAGEPVVWTGAAALESPAAGSLDLQTQVGEEGAFDLVIEVACAAGTTAHWSLVLDTPSTADTPMAANGWGVDMAPEVPESAQGCGVGDILPNLET